MKHFPCFCATPRSFLVWIRQQSMHQVRLCPFFLLLMARPHQENCISVALGQSQQRFSSFVTVVQQLWDGDPPEVWEAAQRLRDAGRSRDRVLDRLTRTWDAHGGDDERYAAALKEP